MTTTQPLLYGLDKNGTFKTWAVSSEGDTITVTHGKEGGKLQSKTTVCKGKSIGRSNETSPEEQAVLEAESKWRKQIDKFYRETKDEVLSLETEGVMLSQDGMKKFHLLDDVFDASRKLDGVRCKSVYKDGVLTWNSRGGKTYPVPEHLKDQMIKLHTESGYEQLDGECLVFGFKLQDIQSAVKKPNELTPQLTYEVFDAPKVQLDWTERLTLLRGLQGVSDTLSHVNIVEYEEVTKDNLYEVLDKYIAEGYEGLMGRNKGKGKGLYEFQNKRSNDSLKFKRMQDSEAKVIGCREDKNQEGVLLCAWQGVEFELKMKGDHAYRCYEVQQGLIGSWINFKYQDVTKSGAPTFAVGLYVRECSEDGTPLV